MGPRTFAFFQLNLAIPSRVLPQLSVELFPGKTYPRIYANLRELVWKLAKIRVNSRTKSLITFKCSPTEKPFARLIC